MRFSRCELEREVRLLPDCNLEFHGGVCHRQAECQQGAGHVGYQGGPSEPALMFLLILLLSRDLS